MPKWILLLTIVSLIGYTACTQNNQTTTTPKNNQETPPPTTAPKKTITKNGEEVVVPDYPPQKYLTLKSGKEIPKAERGITVSSQTGWTEKQMEFQQGYCEQTMAGLDQIDGTVFCKCFLEKIQYFYKPIYARDAYDDQKRWNQECFYEATLAK